MAKTRKRPQRAISNESREFYRGRRLAFEILNRVLLGGGYSNVLLAGALAGDELTIEDKSAATNLVYGVLRNLTLLDEIFRSKTEKGRLDLSPKALTLGRMAIYEILFSQSVPQYASVSEYVKMSKAESTGRESQFLNACLRQVKRTDGEGAVKYLKNPVSRMALRYSHPDWITGALFEIYGEEETSHILCADNNPQPSYFRVNVVRVSVEELMSASEYLRREFQACGSPPNCVFLPHGSGGFPGKEYESGWITPQDRSTQFVPFYLQPQPGDDILDLCCGAGIKSTQIMELMAGQGRVVAVDLFPHKLESLKAEAARLGLGGIETAEADIEKTSVPGTFDKVLLDAPCTGSGTFRRRPEIRFRLKESDVPEITAKQDRLLSAAGGHVAPGGILVYATCSILRRENEERVEKFLGGHGEFAPATAEIERKLPFVLSGFHRNRLGTTFLPVAVNGCGAFVSVLRREQD
jgi:16S rRNA (cytosine967-C5)-methyltransferase